MKTYVIADIHGRVHAFKEVMARAKFDYANDRLINLGDTCDGGRFTKQCIDELLKITHRVDVQGNHCQWVLNWFLTGIELPVWVNQGGYATMESYDFDRKNVPESHVTLLKNAIPYYVDEKNRIYVHGGFNPKVPIENQNPEFIMWDRTLIKFAQKRTVPQYDHVFVGHTTTQLIKRNATTPLTFNNLTMCDCGGGWNGRLAMINVDDLDEFYVSETQTPSKYEWHSFIPEEG